MKELSVEEKAKAYDEALERMKSWARGEHPECFTEAQKAAEFIFPELKESEDEKIRQFLIHEVTETSDKVMSYRNMNKKDVLAWLEKQGSEPNWCHHKVDLSDCSEEYCKAYYDGWNNCNQQHAQLKAEQKPAFEMKSAEESLGIDSETYNKIVDECIYGEQKSTDKVEPQLFHEGDWVIDKQGIVHQIANVIENVTNHTYGYDIVGGGYFNDNAESVRLWTINDAKDGDVLYLQKDGKEHIIIYKGVIKERFRTFVSAYCAYNGIVDAFCFADVSRYVDIAYGGIMPATKKQRDTLMKAMADAGYEWDAEKKELKKIKLEEHIKGTFINVDEVRENFIKEVYRVLANDTTNDRANDIIYYFDSLPTIYLNTNKPLSSGGDDFDMNYILENQAWGEEDEETLKDIITSMTNLKDSATSDALRWIYDSKINWLESLKGRYTWKPSDEQMGVIEAVINNRSFQRRHLDSLYADLKKLRKE